MPPRNNRRQGTRRQQGDISQQHGFPFPVFNEEEVAIFKSLETRHVTSPKWFDLSQHEQDARLNRRYGSVITGYIEGLSVEVLARNKSPGFREIMLEFITTFKEGVTGNMNYRLKGAEYELKENEAARLFGIDGHGRGLRGLQILGPRNPQQRRGLDYFQYGALCPLVYDERENGSSNPSHLGEFDLHHQEPNEEIAGLLGFWRPNHHDRSFPRHRSR
ncbi:hypothetical protein CASFOL_040264 [Castilleja foliolosa]|uniref:Uncharacterized protein n=1 Tax=Castilleja foliolosa TaxID=1961234 RepID=A0ABD3BGQ7_9LAMI